jgi:hypothetical protein
MEASSGGISHAKNRMPQSLGLVAGQYRRKFSERLPVRPSKRRAIVHLGAIFFSNSSDTDTGTRDNGNFTAAAAELGCEENGPA